MKDRTTDLIMGSKTQTPLPFPQETIATVRRFSNHMTVENPTDQLVIALADREARDEEEEAKTRKIDQQWKSMFVRGAAQHFEYVVPDPLFASVNND